ncbi:molecular chaperone DnaJ [Euhalothece natronophila Z-M001]|uniref:Molecular chaperone DnaJ n=1 Tax=Euhalothece natronophila Z-M001 TaxID=522448 RepID=A0A5B8NMI4_9CHRO|nr:molecular chaperone DnaJ [Euhalothece natronophila]QDZ40264.1 molecular chaperone DnaJ [Euhalothece natronophila Z-M001]
MNQNTTPNPYDVLEVSPAASKAEITKAFTQAMKKRKYSTNVIAQARKSLTNPQQRIKADYLRPILPTPKRFKRQDYSELQEPPPEFHVLPDYDNLEEMLQESQSTSSLDQKIGTDLVNFLLSQDL